MDQLDGPAGWTSSLYLKPWPVRIFKDWPFSLYIVTASESDVGFVSPFPFFFWALRSHFDTYYGLKLSHNESKAQTKPKTPKLISKNVLKHKKWQHFHLFRVYFLPQIGQRPIFVHPPPWSALVVLYTSLGFWIKFSEVSGQFYKFQWKLTRDTSLDNQNLKNPEWPPGVPKMVDRVWKGVYP